MTNPVNVHLTDLDIGEVQVFKQMVELQVGAKGGPMGVDGDGLAVGDVASTYGCLRSTDITKESTSVGGWHIVQETGDCGGYLEQNISMKG